ncbi:MAG: Gfo/Idh/MocA family protein [Candidatus Acetothermia bacterium]
MTLNFGIAGPGSIADRALSPAIKKTDGVNLWSVASRNKARAQKFAEKHDAMAEKPAFDNYEEMLEDPKLDAVVISTPDRTHHDYGVKAARAGKHVLTEKPMTASSREGRDLLNSCLDHGVKLGIAYHLRWHAGHRELIKLIHNGAIGDIQHARIHWTFKAKDDSNWRAHEDLGRWWGLAGVGTHGLDLIRWAMAPTCGEVVTIESTVAHDYWNSPHDETAMVNLKFESGATAELTTSVLFDSESQFSVYGREGSAICRRTLGPHGGGNIRLLDEELDYEQVNPYAGEIRDFALAIEEDRAPEVDGKEGLRNVEILEQAA